MLDPSQLFKCLGDETRLKATLLILAEGELCVCELVEALAEPQSKVSRHLAQLRNCQLLIDSRRDQWVYYQINPKLPSWGFAVLQQASAGYEEVLQNIQKQLKAMQDRPNCC